MPLSQSIRDYGSLYLYTLASPSPACSAVVRIAETTCGCHPKLRDSPRINPNACLRIGMKPITPRVAGETGIRGRRSGNAWRDGSGHRTIGQSRLEFRCERRVARGRPRSESTMRVSLGSGTTIGGNATAQQRSSSRHRLLEYRYLLGWKHQTYGLTSRVRRTGPKHP